MNNLTVVITNYKRPQFLRRCFDSLTANKVSNIVVASYATNPDVESVHRYIQQVKPDTRIVALSSDLGCNELWLAGLYQARTDHVLLMHDDDFLTANWLTFFQEKIQHQLGKVGFCIWDGVKEVKGNMSEVVPSYPAHRKEGVRDSAGLLDALLAPNRLAISPVVSIFRRDLCIRTLKECQQRYLMPEHFTRPTMMVGNDMMLYLRHCEKFRDFYYLPQALTAYGHHDESETLKFVRQPGGMMNLASRYAAAQNYFKYNRAEKFRPNPRILHVVSSYVSRNADTERRRAVARQTWQSNYERGIMQPCHIRDSDIPRSSKSVMNDDRTLPFIKDMIDVAGKAAAPEDIILLTNEDICLHSRADNLILEALADKDCIYSFRTDFMEKMDAPKKDEEIKNGKFYVGADLFAFRLSWWREFESWYPDMLLGCEAWDWILRVLMEISMNEVCYVPHLMYHEKHHSFWEDPKNKTLNPGQRWNRALAKSWFRRRLGYDGTLE